MHKQEIAAYYKILFAIKRDLGILPPGLSDLSDISNYEIHEGVELYIEPYARLTAKRTKRIETIKTILNRNNIVHNL